MTVRKVILYSLAVAGCIGANLAVILVFRGRFDFEGLIWIFVSLLIVWALGLFLGVLASGIIRKPTKEPYIYLGAQILIGSLVITFFVVTARQQAKHGREIGNIEHNRDFVDWSHGNPSYTFTSWDEPYVLIAFRKLESNFTDRNAYHLTSCMSSIRDTFLESRTDSIVMVYFTYEFEKQERFTRISIYKDSPRVDVFNETTVDNIEYLNRRNKADQNEKETMEELKKELDELPDSTRKMIADTIRKALDYKN